MLTEQAINTLMSARFEWRNEKEQFDVYFINRTLGIKTWQTKGKNGARKDIAELYRHGLIHEFHSPFSPPCYLTKKGQEVFALLKAIDARLPND